MYYAQVLRKFREGESFNSKDLIWALNRAINYEARFSLANGLYGGITNRIKTKYLPGYLREFAEIDGQLLELAFSKQVIKRLHKKGLLKSTLVDCAKELYEEDVEDTFKPIFKKIEKAGYGYRLNFGRVGTGEKIRGYFLYGKCFVITAGCRTFIGDDAIEKVRKNIGHYNKKRVPKEWDHKRNIPKLRKSVNRALDAFARAETISRPRVAR